MATRAIQDPLQILGFRDPTTDAVLAGGSVEFYAGGTTNAKEAWEDKDKLTAVTSVTLDSAGQAQLYFDGTYKFIVKNAAGTTRYTLNNLKYQARNTLTKTITADYQCTAEDDYILVNTDGGAVTITLLAVAGVVAPITIKNIGSSSLNVTVDGSGAELIDGAATATLADNTSQQYVTDGIQWYGAGIATGNIFTSTSLVFGTTITGTEAAGITTLEATGVESTDGTLVLNGGTDGADATFTGDVTGDLTGGIVETGSSVVLNVEVIEIGDWDMVTTASVSVAPGVALANIRSIDVTIRTDSGVSYNLKPLNYPGETSGVISITSIGDINLLRDGAGTFVSSDYDLTSYNRGWITIWYTA